jgi:hypothetical protein
VGCQIFCVKQRFEWGSVIEAAEIVAVMVNQQGTGVGFAIGIKVGELGYS